MKKRTILLCMACVFLVGCGDPLIEMTESQTDLITTYAAGTLLKFSPAGKHGLMHLPRSAYEKQEEEPVAEIEEEKKETPDASADADTKYLTDSAEEQVASTTTPLSEIYRFNGATLSYQGFETVDSYVKGDYFSLTPSRGKTFLVLRFTLTNESGDTITVDPSGSKVSFSASVNGKKSKAVETLLLSEDLTTMHMELSSGESTDAALIFEVNKELADDISTLELCATVDGKTGALELE